MQNHQTQSAPEEIDLGVVFQKIKTFFKSILIGIIQIFQFFWKHKFILIGLLIFGAIVGYYLESNSEKIYKNEIIIQPNFGSVHYLYSKVEVISDKINTKDSVFLSSVFGNKWEKSWKIEIEPIVDVFEFTSRNNQEYKETFERLLDESGKLSFIEEDPIITKAYKYHKIKFFNKGQANGKKLSGHLLEFLNKNDYFISMKGVAIENAENRLNQNLLSINQIDTIIQSIDSGKLNKFDSEGISFNAAQNMDDLIARKRLLLSENKTLNENLINFQEINRLVDIDVDILYKDEFLMKNKAIIVPLFLILFYCLIFLVKIIIQKSNEFIKA